MSTLADRACIARLRRREFPYYATLKGKGKDIEEEAGAESRTVQDPKQRLFKHWDKFNELKNTYAQAYNWFRSVTRPWNEGEYLIPNEKLLENLAKFGEYKTKAANLLESMEADYDHNVALDKEVRKLAKDDDYPATFSGFKDRFSMDMEVDPIGNPNDFRNVGGLDPEQVEELVKSAEERIQKQAKDGAKAIVEKLVNPLNHLSQKLSDPDARFRKNSLENVQEACEVVRSLNFDNDPTIEDWIKEVESSFNGLTADIIRDNVAVRSDVASNARKLADRMKSFLG